MKKALMIVVLIIFIWIGFKVYIWYQYPPIEGKWISYETGKEIEFTQNKKVIVSNKEVGSYVIQSPNKMLYYVENQEFNMEYRLEKRKLIWGIDEEDEEVFERKVEWSNLGLDIFS